ncbi:hypothetical protein QTP86_017065, partial [Hemibagrus guttatus]
MLLATVNQGGAEFTHGRGDAQNFTLCLSDISDEQYTDGLEAVTLADGSTAYIQRNTQDIEALSALDGSVLEGQVIQLDDVGTAYIQHIAVQNGEEPSGLSDAAMSDIVESLEAGQAVQLEDGSTAYLHHIPKEVYNSPALQAVQLEDGSTAFIQHALQMSQPDTILAIQESDRVSDLPLEEITDPETVTVMEQYAAKIEEMEPYANSGLLTNENVVQIVFPSQDGHRRVQQPEEKLFQCSYEGCGKLYTTAYHLKTRPPALPEGPRGVPRPAERHSLSSESWVFPGASSRWGMTGTPLQGDVPEASETDARATSTAPFRCGGAAALLRAPPGHVSGVEEILEVFLPPSDNIPSRDQQLSTSTINSVGRELLTPSETRVFAPETTTAVVCLACRYASAASGVPRANSIGLLLQLDGIPYFQCPPLCSGIATAAGTRDLTATAPDGCINNGGGEHGPLRLNVPNLPRDLVETLPEAGVENPPNRGISKTFPTDPHNTFGPAKSVRHPPPQADPTHHQVHARVHTGDKPYCCDKPGCEKRFATGHGLKSHMRTHTGEKPYCCTEMNCKKSFKNSGDLQKHMRIHTGEKPFLCPYEGCGRFFRTSNICKVHMRTHTGEKPYHCTEPGCNRAFASATNYKNHSRIHTGERPYVCTIPGCDKRFTEYSSLYKHQVVHTPCKPYECSHCGKTYKQISTLALHKRTAHNDSEPIEEENEDYEPPAEAIDDPCMNDTSGESVAPCSDMTSDFTAQEQVTLVTQDDAHQVVANTITMVTHDGDILTLPASESLLSSKVSRVTADSNEGQTKQEVTLPHPLTLLTTSNGKQVAVELREQLTLEEAL